MSETMDLEGLRQQVVDLQTQVAFQEQTIHELNTALTHQHADIELLRREWKLFRERQTSLQEQLSDGNAHEKPPHY